MRRGKQALDKVWAALAHTADGVYAVDRGQRIVFWNLAANRILGYQADEVVGRPCHQVLGGRPRPGCWQCRPGCAVIRAARRRQTVSAYNLFCHTKAGKPILLNVSVVVPPLRGRMVLTIHLFRDITSQLHYETYVELTLRAALRLVSSQAGRGQRTGGEALPYTPLTRREQEVLSLLVEGQGLREIATALRISYATVRNYVQNILRKLGVHSQREVVRWAIDRRVW